MIRQIYDWRAQGLGFRAIASRLTEAGIACPSAADRDRNPHRLGRAWSINAVRAIVLNPKYKGDQTYGRYRKVERLRDVENPSAGHLTREVPSSSDDVLTVCGAIEAIVTEEQWQAAQPGVSPTAPGPRPDRLSRTHQHPAPSGGSRYALRGLLICAVCGRKMQGNVIGRRKAEARLGYRCVYRNDYPGDLDHPRSLFVAENRILPVVDSWLAQLSSRNLEQILGQILAQAALEADEAPELRRARMVAEEAQTKLDRYMDAIEKGMDPTLYVERSRVAQQELAAAQAILARNTAGADTPLTEEQLRALIARVGSVVGLLEHADPDERRRFYQELGLNLTYKRSGDQELVRASLGVEFSRVGGAFDPPNTPAVFRGELAKAA